MLNENVVIERVSRPCDIELCFNIRTDVFIKEQNVSKIKSLVDWRFRTLIYGNKVVHVML